MDIVFIENLKFQASIGVWEWEARIKQNLIVDLWLGTDIKVAAETDQLEYAVNYKSVSIRISELINSRHYKLIETVAEEIASTVLSEFDVTWCKVKVSKPRAVENSKNVGIIIERTDAKSNKLLNDGSNSE